MTISWTQKAWCNVKRNGQMVRHCWRLEGTRKDGRTFLIVHIPAVGWVCTSFNGTRLGVGKTLSEAQRIAENQPAVKVAPMVKRPSSATVSQGA